MYARTVVMIAKVSALCNVKMRASMIKRIHAKFVMAHAMIVQSFVKKPALIE